MPKIAYFRDLLLAMGRWSFSGSDPNVIPGALKTSNSKRSGAKNVKTGIKCPTRSHFLGPAESTWPKRARLSSCLPRLSPPHRPISRSKRQSAPHFQAVAPMKCSKMLILLRKKHPFHPLPLIIIALRNKTNIFARICLFAKYMPF